MVHENPWRAGNPYISTLIEELWRTHPEDDVSWGRELFWNNKIFTYDIVHFHWPQAFMSGDAHDEREFLKHIERMQEKGVKIVATCHDLEPHYSQCSEFRKSIEIVYSHADAIIHLGEYSKNLFEKKYKNKNHYLLPHHLYNTVYRSIPSKEESLKKLDLDPRKYYILCFGTFRSEIERNLVKKVFSRLKNKQINILAPGYMDVGRLLTLKGLLHRIKKIYVQLRYHIYCTGRTFAPISDNDLPYYFGVANMVFIQRLKILNSGNAVLPMLFGKVVVGPNVGNVGPLLKKWNYPTFNVKSEDSIIDAVRKCIDMSWNGAYFKQKEMQMAEYSTERITQKLYELYGEILNEFS